jgi:hypothetical protein
LDRLFTLRSVIAKQLFCPSSRAKSRP